MNKKSRRRMLVLILVLLLASGCGQNSGTQGSGAVVNDMEQQAGNKTDEKSTTDSNKIEKENRGDSVINTEMPGFGNGVTGLNNQAAVELDTEESFGEDLSEELYAGYSDSASTDLSNVVVRCVSGSEGCYTIEGSTLTFTKVSEDSVYAVSGQFQGNIVIDIGDDYKFDLELQGVSVISDSVNPVTVLSGDRVTITAKKGFENYIYDMREAVEENGTDKAGAIYSEVDLRIAGKGKLTVVSESNNGIHTKDDLEVKNLALTVRCVNNALKGNDSVTLENATTTLIATTGDGIKTTKSDVSSKGNQKGIITINGGTHNIYAACDGIDAAYDVVVQDSEDSSVVLNIFTDKYSNYSEEVTAVTEDIYYIRSISKDWKYSVKYYNSDEDFVWVHPEYHSKISAGRSSYYYFSFPKMAEYSKMQFFIYSAEMEQGQETEYLAATDYLTINEGYDTFALESRNNGLSYSWTNYTTAADAGMGGFGGRGGFGGPGGFGGMNEGNSDKGDYSTKGIKAANEVIIYAGAINIKAYDDAIHANNDTALENGEAPNGNIMLHGGVITVYSNDDGLHADGTVSVSDGHIMVLNSYEGVEGTSIEISGGKVSVYSKDDGINGTATTGTAVTVSGGELYIYCSGDGIDSNSRTSYGGIVFSGGRTVVISTSGGNSAIDSEQGYSYSGGQVLAIMPSGGMSQEAVHCKDFSAIGSNRTATLSAGKYITVTVDGEDVVTLKMPSQINGRVIYLGSNAASVSSTEETAAVLNSDGVCWFE